jgi:hypothetical protein
MAKQCSQDAYRKLIRDGVLIDGDCPNPDDLSVLADSVFTKRGSQAELVDRLSQDQSLTLPLKPHPKSPDP